MCAAKAKTKFTTTTAADSAAATTTLLPVRVAQYAQNCLLDYHLHSILYYTSVIVTALSFFRFDGLSSMKNFNIENCMHQRNECVCVCTWCKNMEHIKCDYLSFSLFWSLYELFHILKVVLCTAAAASCISCVMFVLHVYVLAVYSVCMYACICVRVAST